MSTEQELKKPSSSQKEFQNLLDQDFKDREASIAEAQLREQGKPENMIPNIIKGKLNKFLLICYYITYQI